MKKAPALGTKKARPARQHTEKMTQQHNQSVFNALTGKPLVESQPAKPSHSGSAVGLFRRCLQRFHLLSPATKPAANR